MIDSEDTRYAKLISERRLARVAVDLEIFASLLRDGHCDTFLSSSLPFSALFVSAGYVVEMYGCQFLYADESFEPVPQGVEVPLIDVTVTRKPKAGDAS